MEQRSADQVKVYINPPKIPYLRKGFSISDTMGTVPMEKRRYIIYYQWVVLVLLLESFVFYLPAFLWKIWEGGRLKHLCDDFHKMAVCKDKSRTHLRVLVKYFSSDYKETHFRYFASYVFCEILNLSVSVSYPTMHTNYRFHCLSSFNAKNLA